MAEQQAEEARIPAGGAPQGRDALGRFLPTHGAYRVAHAFLRPKMPPGWAKVVNRLRFEFAISLGFPSWTGAPAPARAAIDNAIRQQLLAERLFAGFWRDEEPPKRFDTVSENLRRGLVDLGLDAKPVTGALERYLRERYGAKEAKP